MKWHITYAYACVCALARMYKFKLYSYTYLFSCMHVCMQSTSTYATNIYSDNLLSDFNHTKFRAKMQKGRQTRCSLSPITRTMLVRVSKLANKVYHARTYRQNVHANRLKSMWSGISAVKMRMRTDTGQTHLFPARAWRP